MNGIDWMVLGSGALLVTAINWYFFGGSPVAAPVVSAASGGAGGASTGPVEATIVVDGGYSPAALRLPAGRPVRLLFDRRETNGCSEEVVIPDLGVRRYLPAHETTAVDVVLPAAGSYTFTCGMGMLRGRLIAE